MNKLIIPIFVVIIIAAGIGAFFVFQKSAFSEPKMPIAKFGRCGDGICDEFEKKNPTICPQDCKEQAAPQLTSPSHTISTKSITPNIKSQVSPFGVFNPYTETIVVDRMNISRSEINQYLGDLGVKWVQEMPVPNSTNIESVPQNIKVYSRLVAMEGGNQPPNVSEEYKKAARDIVRKYKDRVKIWEVDTEPNAFWGTYPKEYAEFLQTTYKIIKGECSDCKVVLGGLSSFGYWNITEAGDWEKVNPGDAEPPTNDIHNPARFLKAILENGAKGYFDIFEFKQHHARAEDYKLLKNRIEVFGKILSNYGINVKEVPIYLETAMYDGQPAYPARHPIANLLPYQTESQQAAALLKTYVYSLVQGIDKIFWMYVIERKPNHQVFSHYGFIHDNGSKKLSYYTYKKMVEVLEGSDWNNIQTIQEKDGVYVYKFTKNGKSIYAAWNDNSASKTIEINTGNIKQVKITEAIPKYESGKEVTDYNTAFNTETKSVAAGKITLTLKDKPMFVEEK
ncbi:MAG: hypothetical protein HY035_06200 [Nitrospirae bacterium]|nr:hypothetical protein [Nitrospirota bacterium]